MGEIEHAEKVEKGGEGKWLSAHTEGGKDHALHPEKIPKRGNVRIVAGERVGTILRSFRRGKKRLSLSSNIRKPSKMFLEKYTFQFLSSAKVQVGLHIIMLSLFAVN